MSAFDLLERIEARCRMCPDRPAIAQPGRRTLTFGDMLERVQCASRGLEEMGLTPGDRVWFAVRPGADAVVLLLAILRAGGVIATMDAGMADQTFRARRSLIRPRWVVAESAAYMLSASTLLRRLLRARGFSLPPLARLGDMRFIRVGPWLPGVPRSRDAMAWWRGRHSVTSTPVRPRAPRDDALVVSTSGTTSAPKAVVHSWRSLNASIGGIADQLRLGASDVVYASDMHLVIPALLAGARAVLPRRGRRTSARTVHETERAGVTHAAAVPSDVLAMIEHCERTGARFPPTLRVLILQSAPTRAPMLRRLRAVIPSEARVLCVYGMTEILPVACATLDEVLASDHDGCLLGRLLPGVSARIDDRGELHVAGPGLFTGYVNGGPVTEHATGDLARMDARGRLLLLGRAKDMIIRRGFNIYPELYEPVVDAVPGVSRCAIVGWYDEVTADERVVLVVEAADGVDEDALRRRLERELRDGPHGVDAGAYPDEIVFRDIPLAGRSRKVDKRALREALAAAAAAEIVAC